MEKICVVCGKKFVSNKNAQKCCSEECKKERKKLIDKEKIKNKKLTCCYCGKKFKKRHRGSKDANKFCCRKCSYEYYKVHTGRYCKQCGKELIAGQKEYCSKECKDKYTLKTYVCNCCGNIFKSKKERKYCSKECYLEKMRQNKIENFVSEKKICKYCGKEFWTEYGKKNREYCSKQCMEKNIREQARIKRRLRIKTNGIFDNDITLRKVYKKYKGICSICGKKVDYKDYIIKDGNFIIGRNYPSIDHIIPLSKGGTHTWNNIQLAHVHCNSLKSDGYVIKDNGQLSIL